MYRLFGGLLLDSPSPDRMLELKALKPYLRELESQQKPSIDRSEISGRLSRFRSKEIASWDAYPELPMNHAEHLVTPSGSWNCRLAHHLHVPSFTSLNISNGEVGDITSPCTELVMGNNFDEEKHFIFDHFHRRTPFPLKPFKIFPEKTRKIHQELTNWIRESIHAKVEIIYGADIREWARKDLNLTHLHLWGEYQDVWLSFEWAKLDLPPFGKNQILRILLFALHPQCFLSYHMISKPEAAKQDDVVSCAYKLAGLPYNEKYYLTRPWTSKSYFLSNAVISQLGKYERSESTRFFSCLDTTLVHEKDPGNTRLNVLSSSTVESPKEINISVKRLYDVLSQVLDNKKGSRKGRRSFQKEYSQMATEESGFPASLPPIIHEWLTQQEKFFGGPVQKPTDLHWAYGKYCAKDPVHPNTAEVILQLMNFQQLSLLSIDIGLGRTNWNRQLARQFSTFDGLDRICDTCLAPLSPDTLPLFSLDHDKKYLARRVTCFSKICQGLNRHGIPANGAEYVLSGAVIGISSSWHKALRAPEECAHLASRVELWCGYCQQTTIVSSANGTARRTVIDGNPRWTVGDRPKYVPRRFPCSACGNSNKFVPVDDQLAFINFQTLDRMAQRFSHMNAEELSRVFDAQSSASHAPRPRKTKRKRDCEVADDADDMKGLKSQIYRDLKIHDTTKPRTIELKCERCGKPCGKNFNPEWHVHTGEYVALRKPYCPQRCTYKHKVWLIPVDVSISWVRSTKVDGQARRAIQKLKGPINSPVGQHCKGEPDVASAVGTSD